MGHELLAFGDTARATEGVVADHVVMSCSAFSSHFRVMGVFAWEVRLVILAVRNSVSLVLDWVDVELFGGWDVVVL